MAEGWFEPRFERWLEALEDGGRQHLTAKFRVTFEGETGSEVLATIGHILHAYGEAQNDEDRVLQNAWKRILACMGAWDDELKITRRQIARG